jgi:hypothetical protein
MSVEKLINNWVYYKNEILRSLIRQAPNQKGECGKVVGSASANGMRSYKNMKKLMLLLTLSVLLAGCTTQWVPTKMDPAPFNEANTECTSSALQQFPVKNEIAQTSRLNTVRNYCGKNCSFEQTIPMTESYVIDVNERSRSQVYDACMQLKGWRQKIKYLL